MKKYICLILCLCFLLIAGCKDNTNTDTATTKTGSLSDKIEFKIYDDKSKIWLDNTHIKEITLKVENGEKSLIITTTEDGKQLLKNACEANMGKPLIASADKHILYSALVVEPIESGMLLLNNNATDYSYLYNYLTGANDKMAGVTPPDTLISENEAQKIIFDHTKISTEKVSNVKTTLEISEKHFGWQYCINFDFDGLKYNAIVNAHTGSIIKLHTDFT